MFFCLYLIFFQIKFSVSQNADNNKSIAVTDTNYITLTNKNFEKAYTEIDDILNSKKALSFKRAVYLSENAYFNDSLSYDFFNSIIEHYKKLTLAYNKTNKLVNYNYADSISENINAALFKVFTDTIKAENNTIVSIPFKYNFEDALGYKNYQSTFISYLMVTNQGNCHSLPYLYKILTEELGTKSYLALAPMHIYIKQRNKKVGWYNVELTSGQYPNDGYLMATGYISRDNIMSGIYMDTLSLKESIATCLMDLCYAYVHKLGTASSIDFQIKCVNKVLEVKPNYVNALLRLQVLNKALWLTYQQENNLTLANSHKSLYVQANKKLIALGYQDVDEATFTKWYTDYEKNKTKYTNPEINTNFKSSKNK